MEINNNKESELPSSKFHELKSYTKISVLIDKLENKCNSAKTILDTTRLDIKLLKKEIDRIKKKREKVLNKPKKPRQLHGFAKPTSISDELCEFMKQEKGSFASRTDVTKEIIKYIADNKLQNPENRRHILLDDALRKLFGPESHNEVVDYFSMQRYVNRHFPPKKI
jgi:chromatin remodeling complex protein RSC6